MSSKERYQAVCCLCQQVLSWKVVAKSWSLFVVLYMVTHTKSSCGTSSVLCP